MESKTFRALKNRFVLSCWKTINSSIPICRAKSDERAAKEAWFKLFVHVTLSEKKIAHFLSCPVLLSASVRLKTSVIHMWHAYERGLAQTSWKLWIGGTFRVSGRRHAVRDGTNSTKPRRQEGFCCLFPAWADGGEKEVGQMRETIFHIFFDLKVSLTHHVWIWRNF